MKLDRLSVENFGPYYGKQSIDFATDDAANVTVVFGENEFGKTSLMNALRWVLYGRMRNRLGEEKCRLEIVNAKASTEGDWRVSVSLRFHTTNDRYHLCREMTVKETVYRPKSDGDFLVETFLSRNGQPVQGDRVVEEISQILPEAVSMFAIFDGEMLSDFEQLMKESPGQEQDLIKGSIEKILGVPALINGANDLGVLLAHETRRLRSEAARQQAQETAAGELADLIEKVEGMRADREDLRVQVREMEHKADALQKKIEATSAAAAADSRREAINVELRNLSGKRDELFERRKTSLKHAWKDLIRRRIEPIVERLEEGQRTYVNRLRKRAILEAQEKALAEALTKAACEACGQRIPDAQLDDIAKRRSDLEVEIRAISEDPAQFERLALSLKMLRPLAGNDELKHAEQIEKDMIELDLSEERLRRELHEINAAIEGHDTNEIRADRSRHRSTLQLLGQAKKEVSDREREIQKAEEKRDQLSTRLSIHVSGAAAQKVAVYKELRQAFEASIDELRDRLRDEIAKLATGVFLSLTKDPTYRQLEINDNYGLAIRKDSGHRVTSRSAGAEQIVALSLIGALNRRGGKALPMVMDTPLARLDARHRANVLKTAPRMASQVVLLVHDCEIDPVEGLRPIMDTVGARYEIMRDATEAVSTIVRIRED